MAQSFEEFVTVSSPRLVRTARMLLGSALESQDLTQDTLIVMYRHWDRLSDPAAAEAYAYTTLVRLVRRHLRRAHFRYEHAHDVARDDAREAPEPAELENDLINELASLPPRQREAVVLRYYLDLSIQDTARTMRCSPGTVKSQVSKALTTLRQRLQEPDQSKVSEQ